MIISVNGETYEYEITLSGGALSRIGEILDLDRKVLIVTDDGVPVEYAEEVKSAARFPVPVTLPHGEATKSLENFASLLKVMLENGFTRGDCAVAVGGGVIGDLTGFAASAYMRGIDFYNIPTTLLSQVDSSVGGKTAVDFCGIKNSVGTFWQPKKVVIDPEVLHTLDDRLLAEGLAESVKMAATSDAELFSMIEGSTDLRENLEEIIRRSVMIKKAVVERDPTEKGERRVLNFGHTVGHAIESLAGGALLHGECVAVGMLPMCSDGVRKRIEKVLEKYGLPTVTQYKSAEMLPLIAHDKKSDGDAVTAVTVDKIGSYSLVKMTADEIRERIISSGITEE